MKQYHLNVYSNGVIEPILLSAESHTFDNGMIIFWKRNSKGEWAQIAMYPTSRTAVSRIEGPDDLDINANKTIDIQSSDDIKVEIEHIPIHSTKRKGKK